MNFDEYHIAPTLIHDLDIEIKSMSKSIGLSPSLIELDNFENYAAHINSMYQKLLLVVDMEKFEAFSVQHNDKITFINRLEQVLMAFSDADEETYDLVLSSVDRLVSELKAGILQCIDNEKLGYLPKHH
jgi:hypothetical protein